MSGAKRKKSRKRLTIGYLTPWVHDPVFVTLWAGIHDAIREYDANLLCFPGGPIRFPHRFVRYRNVIYDLITEENLDGLIVASAALGAYISQEEFEAFYHRYQTLPMVSVAQRLKDVPSIVIDNAHGMRSAVTHLLDTHGFTRIAFIRGQEGHHEAEQRYRAYADALTERGMPLDPNLIAPGDFVRESGAEAMRLLLDQRNLSPGAGFEAVVAANDDMALGALATLRARGIRVPNDVALVGFDDREESRCVLPPLTTVRNPLYQLGAQAAEMLMAQIKGHDVPECVVLPSDLVVRRSCGCPLPSVAQAAARPVALLSPEDRQIPLADRCASILPVLAQAAETSVGKAASEWAKQLLDAFVGEIDGRKPEGALLAALESALYQTAASSFDAFAWQDVLSTLHNHALPYLSRDDTIRAEGLLGQARVLVGDMAQRFQGHQTTQQARQIQILSDTEYALSTRFDMAELLDTATQEIPKLGVSSFYIALFENPEAPTDWSRLLLAYDGEKRIKVGTRKRRFPSRQLLPNGLLSPERRYSLVLEPLYLRDRQLGFAILEAGPAQALVCEVLRRQVSSALQAVLLLQAREEAEAALERAYTGVEKKIEKRTAELQKEITERKRVEEALKHRLEQLAALSQASQAVTASLKPDQVLAEIVSLANEVVDSDYTGVLLVDDEGNMGQSAENLPGVQALGYRVRENGFTSWIVRTRRAVIVDEIKKDGTVHPPQVEGAPRQANPHLVQADVKSFAGLPLMVKDRLLGVLYLHSLQPRAFGGQLFLLIAFANQVAIALENARLFQAEQQQTQRLALLADVARIVATTFDADALLQAVAESIFRHFDYPRVGLFILDDEGQTLILRGRSSETITLDELAVPGFYRLKINQGICGYVARTGKPHLAPDVGVDPYFVNPTQVPTRSALCVPILEGDAVVGTMLVESERPAAFDEKDQSLLEAVAGSVAIGLRNARLYQETQRRVQELTLLNSITIRPETALDTDTPIESALEGLYKLIRADRIALVSINPSTHTWKITHERIAPGVESVAGLSGSFTETPFEMAALLENQSFAVSDAAIDPRLEATRNLYRSLATKSVLLAPVQGGGRFYGTLSLGDCRKNRAWHADEIRLLEAVARQLGLVLENAHLFEETQQRADELSSALTRLEEMDRIKDEFIQNVSHELRSPLALVRGYAEMLDSGEIGDVPPDQRQPVAIIARRARMLSDLVKDITLILEAEVNPPNPEPIPLDELAQNAVEDFQVEIKQAELTLEAEIEPDLPPVSGAHTCMRRVLDNLLGNAVKFTPAGGTITVHLHQDNDAVALEVSDTGVGIPADKLERIFERFYQVDGSARRRYGGVGLGLALVKEIVEAYGGRVTVESEVGKGSTFTAYIPIFADASNVEK